MTGIALLTAAAADLLTAYSSPIANSAAQIGGIALTAVLKRRLEAARDILIEELRGGEKSIHDVAEIEDLAAITYRYTRAAQEGTARLNLRLMAKVIAGQAHLGNLVADEFLSYADLIASLRREEIILVATMHRLKADTPGQESFANGTQRDQAIWLAVKDHLVPTVFDGLDSLIATRLALSRTGLIVGGAAGFGGESFTTSPLMDRLSKLASFEAALKSEGVIL